ncbi:MAG: prolyl oligopeptidase family serine peptidase [Planctomycetaceae bacterium]|nr:prolyl oligopeptidase family serine peptidase [Planctomycetaceae bacterium]
MLCSSRQFVVLSALLTCLLAMAPNVQAVESFPGKVSDWNGFKRYDFEVDGNPALVVTPEKAAPGRPWVWHGEFFGHKPNPDIELLNRGFHIAYLRVPDMLGSPEAVSHWNTFYAELTGKYELADKVALVGLSRGGLYCYNWAAKNPTKVACIYGDAPVCDFKSWPGGFGKGKGSTRDWKLVLERYGFESDDEARAYDGNPVDQLKPLADAHVPLLHVYGNADDVVPWDENTGLLAARYRALGGQITLIEKPGIGHHPHGLNDSTPIVEFIERHASVIREQKPLGRNDAVGKASETLEPSRQMVYQVIDGKEYYLHLFEPEGLAEKKPVPCFLVIHGGGWTGGEPRRMYPFADYFAKRGMLGVSLHYRLLNKQLGTTVFDCVADGQTAVRFLRTHAEELGIDPDKIVVSGGSAGGHVAAATQFFNGTPNDVSAKPNGLVLLFPVIDTSSAGYGQAKIGEPWEQLSPVHNVAKGWPPTILFHGTADNVTPFAGAEAFAAAMKESGNTLRFHIHEGGDHGYLMRDEALFQQTLKQTEEFLVEQNLLPANR